MAYNHGVRVQEQETSIVAPITGTAGLQVVIGTAPVNLAADPYAVTNVPIIAYSYKEAAQQLGYSDDFKKYTLCQSVDASFRVLNVAPIILINVLDPKKHKKANEETKVAVESMQATVEITGILADTVKSEGVRRAEEEGIIFIDEIDKIAGKGNHGSADVSREGVQRDILPIVEGSTVTTKYGIVKTDYILFIAAGAFHVSSIGDLIPELQGRFPIRVELSSLTKEDFVNILTIPQNAITSQYATLLAVDNIDLHFTQDAIEKIAEIAAELNVTSEDIGARRLHTVMENLVEDISFNAGGDIPLTKVVVDEKYVTDHLSSVIKDHNVKKYIL